LPREVDIHFAGDDPSDRAFAESLAEQVRPFARPVFRDVDELDRLDEQGVPRPVALPGAPIFILSPSLLAKDWNRRKLLNATPRAGVMKHTGFFVCRGITLSELRGRYPDLDPLFFRVSIGDETQIPELLAELRAYCDFLAHRLPSALRVLAVMQLSTLVQFLGYVLWPLGFLSVVLPLPLVVWLVMDLAQVAAWKAGLLAAVSLFGLGWWSAFFPAMDLWPWLGRRWRFPRPDPDGDETLGVDPAYCRAWPSRGLLAPPPENHSGALCTDQDLQCACIWWLDRSRRARLWAVLRSLWMALPALLCLTRLPGYGALALALFAAGLLYPPLYYWTSNRMRIVSYWRLGLTDEELDRTGRFFFPLARHQLLMTASEQRLAFRLWLDSQTLGGPKRQRLWFRPRPRVFVSYSWHTPAEVALAGEIAAALRDAGVEVFLDKRDIGRFGAWRARVSEAIMRATHVIVVAGSDAAAARVFPREIRAAFQRLYTEMLPSFLCVAEPETVPGLIAGPDLPLELRFLLSWCPALSPREARNPALLLALLRQRSRQGLVRDWLCGLFPGVALPLLQKRLRTITEVHP
jgi:hypothetical protein